jgi:hypothetical protein
MRGFAKPAALPESAFNRLDLQFHMLTQDFGHRQKKPDRLCAT